MQQLTPFDPNARAARWSAIALGVIGVEVFIVQPGFVQGIVQALGFSEREAGVIASAEMMGVALTAVAMSFLAARLDWRKVLIAASVLATAANVASVFVDTAFAFAVMRCLAGLGLGALISLSWAAVGLTRNPDRQFSLYLTWVLIYGAAGLLTMPMIFASVGLKGFLLIMAVLSFAGVPLARHMPAFVDSRNEPNADAVEMSVPYKSAALLGVLAYNIAQGIAWAYLFLIGTHAGIADQHVANALTISQVIAIAGALSAFMLGTRLGRSVPLLVGIAGGAASLLLLMGHISLAAYTLAVCAFNYLWNMVLPYILGSVASYDRRGMMVVYAVAAQMIGLGIGPAVGAYAVTGEGFDRTLESSFGLFVLSLVLLMIPLSRHAALRAAHRAQMDAGSMPGSAGMRAATSLSTDKSSA